MSNWWRLAEIKGTQLCRECQKGRKPKQDTVLGAISGIHNSRRGAHRLWASFSSSLLRSLMFPNPALAGPPGLSDLQRNAGVAEAGEGGEASATPAWRSRRQLTAGPRWAVETGAASESRWIKERGNRADADKWPRSTNKLILRCRSSRFSCRTKVTDWIPGSSLFNKGTSHCYLCRYKTANFLQQPLQSIRHPLTLCT